MVDKTVLATKLATLRDACGRVRQMLPPSESAFLADRAAREIVAMNIVVAVQACVDLASHWLADAGTDVPASYRDLFARLAALGLIERDFGERLSRWAGLRNIVAHRYPIVDWAKVWTAAGEIDDLNRFADAIAARVAVETT